MHAPGRKLMKGRRGLLTQVVACAAPGWWKQGYLKQGQLCELPGMGSWTNLAALPLRCKRTENCGSSRRCCCMSAWVPS
jgi:hypothetical protein